jgi:hypothetical protein
MSDNPDDETKKTTSQGGFFVTLFKKVIWMIIFLLVGIAMLYGCKVAAANLIPTSLSDCDVTNQETMKKGKMITSERVDCNIPDEIPQITTVNITIANNKQGVPYSKRLSFNYNEINQKFINTGIFKYLKLAQEGNNASKGSTFLSKMVEGAIFANFTIFDKVYKTLNSAATTPLGETLVIFILPMIFMYVYPFFAIINMFLFVGFYFYNISIFTKKREPFQPADPPMKTEWVNYEPDEDGEWSTFGKFLLYLGGFFMMGIPLMIGSIMGMLLPIYAIIYPLFATGTVNKRPYNFGNFLTDMLKFKKHMIMYYFSFNVVMGAYNSGPNGLAIAITALLAIAFIWVFDKMFGVFTPYDWEKNDSKVMTVMTGDIPSPMPSGSKPVPVPAPSAPSKPVSLSVPAPSAPLEPDSASGPLPAPVEKNTTQTDPYEGQTGEQIGLPTKTLDLKTPVENVVQPPLEVPQSQQLNNTSASTPPQIPLSGGVSRKEGMLAFAKRIFDTLVKEPLMGEPKQAGGNNSKPSKNMKTKKNQ